MNRVAKIAAALQALLIAPLGAAKADVAATPTERTEAAAWQAALSSGSPEALQQFISRFPNGNHLGEAFGLIVQSEVETAGAEAIAARAVQLADAGLEVLEREFEPGAVQTPSPQNESDRGLAPY